MLTLRQMDSIVYNTLLVFEGFEIKRREEGTNIFYDVHDSHESGKRFLGTYRVWEWHDGSGRDGWMPLDTKDIEINKIRHTVWECIKAIAVPANQSTKHSTAQSVSMDDTEYKKYSESISVDEHFEKLERADADALAYEQIFEQSEEGQQLKQLQKDTKEKIKPYLFNPLELSVIETFVEPDIKLSPMARAAYGKKSIKEFKELLPEIVRAQVGSAKPEKPTKPETGSSIDIWFDYYHAMNEARYKMTFTILADESGYSKNTFKAEHGRYKIARGIDIPNT